MLLHGKKINAFDTPLSEIFQFALHTVDACINFSLPDDVAVQKMFCIISSFTFDKSGICFQNLLLMHPVLQYLSSTCIALLLLLAVNIFQFWDVGINKLKDEMPTHITKQEILRVYSSPSGWWHIIQHPDYRWVLTNDSYVLASQSITSPSQTGHKCLSLPPCSAISSLRPNRFNLTSAALQSHPYTSNAPTRPSERNASRQTTSEIYDHFPDSSPRDFFRQLFPYCFLSNFISHILPRAFLFGNYLRERAEEGVWISVLPESPV